MTYLYYNCKLEYKNLIILKTVRDFFLSFISIILKWSEIQTIKIKI